MPYSDVKLNKINILPQLSGNNNKYYYQIKITEPEEGYNYLLVQTISTKGFILKMSFKQNYIHYPLIDNNQYYEFYFNIPYDKRDNRSRMFINYYYIDKNPGYINFVGANEHFYRIYTIDKELNGEFEFSKKENKVHIKLDFVSNLLYPNIVQYYIIINVDNIETI